MSCEKPLQPLQSTPRFFAIKFESERKSQPEIQEAEIPLWHVMKNSCQGDTPPVAPVQNLSHLKVREDKRQHMEIGKKLNVGSPPLTRFNSSMDSFKKTIFQYAFNNLALVHLIEIFHLHSGPVLVAESVWYATMRYIMKRP